jgi:hypothetical protein
MFAIMQTLPAALRNWDNGFDALTMPEIHAHELTWQQQLLNMYCDGIITKPEANEAWAEWESMKRQNFDELSAN